MMEQFIRRWTRRIYPIEEMKEIRSDLVNLFIHAVKATDDELLNETPNYLKNMAIDSADSAKKSPREPFEKLDAMLNPAKIMYKLFRKFLVIASVLALALGLYFVSEILRLGLSLTSPYTLVMQLGAFASILFLIVLALVKITSYSTMALKELNEELVMGRYHATTRDKEKLAGICYWNSSLSIGGNGLKLLIIFLFLKMLSSVIEKWNPYDRILEDAKSNMDVLSDSDSYREAIRKIRK